MVINIKGYDVIIDDEDYDKITSRTWRVQQKRRGVYFTTYISKHNKKQINLPLHHLIIGRIRGDPRDVDHINRNTLDNRKENLRFATKAQNRWNQGMFKNNTTGYKGVSRYRENQYRATFRWNGHQIVLLVSSDPIECAKAHDMMSIKLYGEFACPNFKDIKYTQEDIDSVYQKAMSNIRANNTSGYTGVAYHKGHKKWISHLRYKGTSYFLGYFNAPEDGARAFDKKLIEVGGNRAKLNFPEEWI